MVRCHAVVLTVLLTGSVAGCSSLPGAFSSHAEDYAAASRVWQDPWVAPTSAEVAGPGYGTDGLLSRTVAGRTTSYAADVESAAAAELSVAADAGWSPTSSACGAEVQVALAGPDDAVAALVVTPSRSGSEVSVTVVTPHHLDDDWSVPATIDTTCLDGAPDDFEAVSDSSEPLRSAELPDDDAAEWRADEPADDDAALLAEVNTELAALGLAEIPASAPRTGDSRRPAPGAERSLRAAGLRRLGRLLDGWTLTWTACGGGSPTRATYVREFDHGPAVVRATIVDGRADLAFTLPIVEAPPADEIVDGLAPLTDPPCLGRVRELTVAGTPAVLPTELTPIAD